jgi:DeoR family deoxyribose operon repressor
MDTRKTRLNGIIDILKLRNGATIRELARELEVSEMTIRRDLSGLAGDAVVTLIHGGAFLNPRSPGGQEESRYSLVYEETRHRAAKMRIGEAAAALVEPQDIIIIDAGSTTECLAAALPADLPLTILCFSLNGLMAVHRRRHCRLIFPGGYFHANSLMFESAEGLELIRRSRATKAFISASGVNDRLGVTCSNAYEVEAKRAAISSSLRKILLVDSSKFGRVRSAYFADLADFDTVVTDSRVPAAYREVIAAAEVGLRAV